MPELEDYFQERKELQALKDSPGWKRFDAALNAQVFVRNSIVNSNRIKRLDDAIEQAGAQGVVEGIQLARLCLDDMLAVVTANINALLELKREEKEHEEMVGADA